MGPIPASGASNHCRVWTLLALLFLIASAVCGQQPVKEDDTLDHIEQLIVWYRDASALEQSPVSSREALFRDGLHKTSSQVLRAALQFARAQAALPSLKSSAGATQEDTRGRNLAQAGAVAEQHIGQLQAQIEEANRNLPNTPAALRANLLAKREKLVGELNLAKARREALQGLLGFLNLPEGGGLAGRINDLERVVPDPESAGRNREPSQELHSASAGIAALTANVFTVSGRMRRVNEIAQSTDNLRQSAEKLRGPLRSALMEVIQRGDAIAKMPDTADAAELGSLRKELDALLARFKQLSAMSAPLAQEIAQLNAVRSNLQQWHDALGEDYGASLRYLLLRLAMLGLAIMVIFLFSALWRRGTMRYVQDMRRRRQVLLLRRIVIGCTITLFVVLSFVTEFGSFATFAGFSVAGIALAMQSVILSVVAYFFLVGRWGVRVGDRITVARVTGDVIEVGLFRVYMMELAGAGPDLYPTGRVVVFPNAVFFQPSALFKQFPGIDYTWRTVSLTLAPYSDFSIAERDLLAAVESVFAEYRESIERQHRAAQSANNLHTAMPRPETRLRFVEGGLEFSVRYPVEMSRASEIDDRITRELIAVIDRHPTLMFARGVTPKVQAEG